ncbi:MAG TPA: phosphatidylglycerol lysyltransferase domain-containing protein [Solirubrobacteraceae bacterium]|nr:phosphatidylglycerol lysyltransferase domain-containing protein [Solirubrobacteraceae bacterium]
MRPGGQVQSEWLPRLAALLAAIVGGFSIATTAAPQISWHGWRTHLLLQVVSVSVVRDSYAISLPLGAALLLVAPYLLKRRRRARNAAMTLFVLLGAISLFRGLDVEGMLLCWGGAVALSVSRREFTVEHEPITLRSAVWRVPLIGALGIGLVSIVDWVSHGRPKFGQLAGETSALVRFKNGQLHFDKHTAALFGHGVTFAWIPLAVHLLEIGTLLAIVYVIFRPLAAPQAWPSASVRRLATQLVREHGQDTLAFFKLRPDKHYFFNEDRTAFVGYRVEAGALLLSGDPVGPPDAFPDLLLAVRRFARSRGLRLAAIGASERMVPIYDGLGLRSLYLGDEAIVELHRFSLEGRPIRKVRQSVTRLRKAGYTAELHTLATIAPADMPDVERVLEVGRIGGCERGFSMGMDSIHGACEQDTQFVLARDEAGKVRGVLHFVPCYGRPAVSLSMMRRDPNTPNGLMEFQVVSAIEMLRDQGVEEMSLNFATAARFIHSPGNRLEALLGRLCGKLDRFFQIESLYRFNVKFFPRWDQRYLIYEGPFGLPRAALASMWAEGQIPKPKRPRVRAHEGQRTLKTANR